MIGGWLRALADAQTRAARERAVRNRAVEESMRRFADRRRLFTDQRAHFELLATDVGDAAAAACICGAGDAA